MSLDRLGTFYAKEKSIVSPETRIQRGLEGTNKSQATGQRLPAYWGIHESVSHYFAAVVQIPIGGEVDECSKLSLRRSESSAKKCDPLAVSSVFFWEGFSCNSTRW